MPPGFTVFLVTKKTAFSMALPLVVGALGRLLASAGAAVSVVAMLRTLWTGFANFFSWLKDKAIVLFVGTKFWATFAFVAVAAVIFSSLSTLFNHLVRLILSRTVSHAVLDSSWSTELAIVNQVLPFDVLASMVSTVITAFGIFTVFAHTSFFVTRMVRLYGIASRAWKT